MDDTFLFYGGGIYNDLHCCTVQNHAILVVGYGTDKNGQDYWVALNRYSQKSYSVKFHYFYVLFYC